MWFFRLFLILTIGAAVSACMQNSNALRVGEQAPSIRTKTLADVNGDLSRITTYRYPDERMYQQSLDKALKMGKPIVLEFATPAHCTVCDKQLQMLKALLEKYQDDVIFLHMDQYQNPEAFRAFYVIGDPWTFVIDSSRTVRYKEPGRMLYGELDALIKAVLKSEQNVGAEAG
jgi:thiol-disulfide isomerase/thioredoxin